MTPYEIMIEEALRLDQRAARPQPPPPPRQAHANGAPASGAQRPGDDYGARAEWADVLGPHGWKLLRVVGNLAYWQRPDKDGPGISATTGLRADCGKDLLFVFTTSTVLDAEHSYSKFAAYAHLNHGGDYQAAAAALAAKGYGEQPGPTVEFERGAAPPPRPQPPWDVPLPLDRLAPPEAFPLDVLPGPLAEYVEQCAWATNSPTDFVAVPLLALAAGCIGASSVVGITRNHVQPATLYAVVVGLPGTGKSPALESVLDPLETAEAEYRRQWKADMRAWRADDPKDRGSKPVLRRVVVDDTTSEALMRTLHTNARGVVMVRDELSALIAGFNQYKGGGKGNDRQVYLKAWSAATIRVDRKGDEDGLPLVIPRPSLSIVGGVQPDVVRSFLGSDDEGRVIDDGLLDRFLFCYPRDLPAVGEQFREVDSRLAAAWDTAARWLLSLQQWPAEHGPRPKVVTLDAGGRQAWADFTSAHAAELNDPEFPDWKRGPWSKLRGYCARLALVLHCLRLACSEGRQYDGVGADDIQAAARLIGYFKAHYLRVAVRMGADPRLAEAARILGWLKRNPGVTEFSRRDAYRVLTHSFSTPEALDEPMRLLVLYGYVRRAAVEVAPTGRKPGPRWEVNPTWDRSS